MIITIIITIKELFIIKESSSPSSSSPLTQGEAEARVVRGLSDQKEAFARLCCASPACHHRHDNCHDHHDHNFYHRGDKVELIEPRSWHSGELEVEGDASWRKVGPWQQDSGGLQSDLVKSILNNIVFLNILVSLMFLPGTRHPSQRWWRILFP